MAQDLDALWEQAAPVRPKALATDTPVGEPRGTLPEAIDRLWETARPMDPDPEVPWHETLGASAGDALTMGFGDELGAGFQGALAAVTPGMKFMDTYRQARDENRRRAEAGGRQNPWASKIGTALGVGTAIAAPLPVLKLGGSALARIASGLATGFGYGGVASAGRSQADLTRGEWSKFGTDMSGEKEFREAGKNIEEGGWRGYGKAALNIASAGAPGGAIAGGGLSAAMEGLRKAGPAIGRYAIRQGRRVLTNGADSQSNRALVSDEAVREALDEKAIHPLGNTEETLQRLEDLTAKYGPEYRQIVDKLEKSGVAGPKASAIAEKLLERAVYLEKRTGANKSIPNAFIDEAANAESIAADDGRLGLSQGEDVKRALQKEAKYGKLSETPMNEAKREIASTYRQAVEDAIGEAGAAAPEGSPLRELAESFVPTKQKLGRLMEAEAAAERGNARVGQRSSGDFPSPLEAAMAVSSGHPEAVLVKPAFNFIKNRGTSTVAAGADKFSKALKSGLAGSNAVRYAEQVAGAAAEPMTLQPAYAAPETAPQEPRSLRRALGRRRGTVDAGGEGMRVQYEPPPGVPLGSVRKALAANPSVFGRYAPQIEDAASKSDSALATTLYRLSSEDQDLAARVRALRGR